MTTPYILLFLWNTVLYIPILNILMFFYVYTNYSLGVAIILLTLLVRVILIPLTLPSLKAAVKQKELAPLLDDLKKKYGTDKKLLAEKQMELYKKHGFNPASGCLPQIAQLFVLIALYQVLLDIFHKTPDAINALLYFPFIKLPETHILGTSFLYLNMAKPDPYYVLPIIAGASQFFLSKLMMPVASKMEKISEKTPDKTDDVMYNMQKQSLYIMPVMTIFIGFNLPSGLILYWIITTVFSVIQQWIINKRQLKK